MSWRTLDKDGITISERDHFGSNNAGARKGIDGNIPNLWYGSGQRMQSAALVVQVNKAMMMIGVSCADALHMNVGVADDGRDFKYVQGVIVYQRNHSRDLGDDKERQNPGTKTSDGSK